MGILKKGCAANCRCSKHQPETAEVFLAPDRKTLRREQNRRLKNERKYGKG